VKRRLMWFVVGCVALWLAAVIPAWFIAGEPEVIAAGAALLLCCVPMAATLLWCSWALRGTPEIQLAAVMGGTALRFAFVAITGVVLFENVALLNKPSFLLWVVFFYLTTLSLEVVSVIAKPEKAS
jgi:hypothetical protein